MWEGIAREVPWNLDPRIYPSKAETSSWPRHSSCEPHTQPPPPQPPWRPHRVCSQPVGDGGGLLVNTHHLLHVIKAGIVGHHVIEGGSIVLHNAWEWRAEGTVTRGPKKVQYNLEDRLAHPLTQGPRNQLPDHTTLERDTIIF